MMARTQDFALVLENKIANDPKLAEAVANESVNVQIAMMVYDARTKARLTQRQLADRIGTTQSVVSRIEDADYTGHSIALLNRIANAIGSSLQLNFRAPEKVRKIAHKPSRSKRKGPAKKKAAVARRNS